MKLKDNFKLQDLEDYGFTVPTEDDFPEDIYIQDAKYIYECGHARRGQWFYILAHENKHLSIYSTEPDGSGGKVLLPNVLIEMVKDDIFDC